MPKDFIQPSPEDLLKGMLVAHSLDELNDIAKDIAYGAAELLLRDEIDCFEHKEGFFEMAERVYVQNGEPKLEDVELGMHEATCQSPVCQRISQVYFDDLRSSTPDDSARIAKLLADLKVELVTGKPRPELEGEPSGVYDSDTGKVLPIAKAVEITDLCERGIIGADIALLTYVVAHRGVRVDIKQGLPGTVVVGASYFLETNGIFQPDNPSLIGKAASMGIDPRILHELAFANAPALDTQ